MEDDAKDQNKNKKKIIAIKHKTTKTTKTAYFQYIHIEQKNLLKKKKLYYDEKLIPLLSKLL